MTLVSLSFMDAPVRVLNCTQLNIISKLKNKQQLHSLSYISRDHSKPARIRQNSTNIRISLPHDQEIPYQDTILVPDLSRLQQASLSSCQTLLMQDA
jgi:hypothetical protein